MITALRQRIRQFREAGAAPTAADFALAGNYLSPDLLALFRRQHPRDIVHGARTARWLIARGEADTDLIVAALVHDAGKGNQRLWDRVVYVLTSWLHLAGLLASPQSRFEVRRAVERSRTHAARGAEALRAAGASERVIALTLMHHEPAGGDGMLAQLQQADAEN